MSRPKNMTPEQETAWLERRREWERRRLSSPDAMQKEKDRLKARNAVRTGDAYQARRRQARLLVGMFDRFIKRLRAGEDVYGLGAAR